MLKILHAAPPCLSQLVSAYFALEMRLAARNCQKIHKNPYFSVQGHPRSLNSAPIESQWAARGGTAIPGQPVGRSAQAPASYPQCQKSV